MILKKFNQYYKRFDVVLRDTDKKPFIQLVFEAIHFGIKKREFPFFYFGKYLYRRGVNNYNKFLSSKEVDSITLSKVLHNPVYKPLLRNKLIFYNYLKHFNTSIVKIIGYNFKRKFYAFSNNSAQVDLIRIDVNFFLNTLLSRSKKHSVFMKPIDDMGGSHCYILDQNFIESNLCFLTNILLEGCFIFQERIIQHKRINELYSQSVNSIRFDSYLDDNDRIHILSAFMRFGTGGAFVDNSSAGGIYVPIDIEKGILMKHSFQLMQYGGASLKSHPDSGKKFEGFEIPFFTQSCILIKELVRLIPDKLIGWDIAITPDGPVAIEGNDNNSMIGPDIAYGGYLDHPMFSEILMKI
ncbi:sugar-transfer associated ATP-grasp domain-containing protein [Aquimarina intermedia]|uniref:Putative polysaccharide biosynthesis protein n=1 Tax=Aquimarina intermedia TaxID=350814 RepID=A0A5S5C6W4_9FLAO|nr:sugar-transfer associated ATP-grasp domain-containing protein [Aquimarina intermedia]TYP75155.1 putative polysaccharide biosynthesis protein [Aquimarina intermedia]